MKKYILIAFLITFSKLNAQKTIELHYEGVVRVDAFNDFGRVEPSPVRYGEFIFSPTEKKLTRYDRDKLTTSKDAYIKTEYTIENSAFLIHGVKTIQYFNNQTLLFDFKGNVAGKIEYNPETKILALTEYDTGNVITSKFWITDAFEKDKAAEIVKRKSKADVTQLLMAATKSASEPLLYNAAGIAEVMLSKPRLNETEINIRIQEFLKKYYMQVRISESNHDINGTIVESSNWDVFNRKIFPTRIPIINERYRMTLITVKEGVKILIQHIDFEVDQLTYYLEFQDLLNDKPNPLLYKEDKPAFLLSTSKVIKSLDYYIDNNEIKYF